MPSFIRAKKSRLTAIFKSFSLIKPSFIAALKNSYELPQFKSQPAFKARAEAEAALLVNLCVFQISSIAPQSETTYPLKPHLFLKISYNSSLALAALLFTRL